MAETMKKMSEQTKNRIIDVSAVALWLAGFLYELPVFVRNLGITESNPNGVPELMTVLLALLLWPFVFLNDLSRWIIQLVT